VAAFDPDAQRRHQERVYSGGAYDRSAPKQSDFEVQNGWLSGMRTCLRAGECRLGQHVVADGKHYQMPCASLT